MMRAFMFPIPASERDEGCEEVRQHLEALIEDHQAQGHSPQKALTLAVQQFGPPFKVGRKIWQKWDVKRQRLLEATQPRLARRKKRFVYLTGLLGGSVPVLIVLNCHYLPALFGIALSHGLVMGALSHYTQCLNTQIAELEGLLPIEERQQSSNREAWKEASPQIAEQLLHTKGLWGRFNLIVAQWAGDRFVEKRTRTSVPSSCLRWKLFWQILGLAYLAVLVLWPAPYHAMGVKDMLIFLYLSAKMSSLSYSLANKRWPLMKSSQI